MKTKTPMFNALLTALVGLSVAQDNSMSFFLASNGPGDGAGGDGLFYCFAE